MNDRATTSDSRSNTEPTREKAYDDTIDWGDFWTTAAAERFRLVLDGENLLSYDRIHDVLGTWPRSLRKVVEKPDEPWAWRHFPTVWVPK